MFDKTKVEASMIIESAFSFAAELKLEFFSLLPRFQ